MGNIICEYCGAKVDLAISDRCPVCGAKIRESTQSEGSIAEKIPVKISSPIEKPNATADREKNSNSTLKIGFIIIGIIVVLGIVVISISISNAFSKQNDASLKSDSYSSYPTPYPTTYRLLSSRNATM